MTKRTLYRDKLDHHDTYAQPRVGLTFHFHLAGYDIASDKDGVG
jgi:hypothetical protein